MSDEEVYEIESIVEARVWEEKKRKRWEFRVRWKGYKPSDDTWEPIENLAGSEETLEHFIQHMNTGGRDHRNLALFKSEEYFLPVGPPRRRKAKEKEKVPKEHTPEPDLPSSSRTRKRNSNDTNTSEDGHSSKRSRPTLQTFGSKPNLLLTEAGSPLKSTSVGDSALNSPTRRQPCSSTINSTTEPEPGSMADLFNFSGNTLVSQSTPVAKAKAETSVVTPPSTGHIESTMPLHRARAANPLVKPLFERHKTSAKNSTAPKRRKPGPGRSSDGLMIRPPTLLTAEKGKLKSIKGKRRAEDRFQEKGNGEDNGDRNGPGTAMDEDVPIEPLKPGGLLHLAGLDSETTDLPGFEDDNTETALPNEVADVRSVGDSLPPAVRENLFPTIASEVESHPEWKRPTIFGLLGLGTDVSRSEPHIPPDQSSIPFQVNFDSTTSLPVLFVDHTSASTFPASALVQSGPPGKFYRGSHATDLLATLRTKSFFARIMLSPEATEAHTANFEHFNKRLCNDELFVEMIGQDLLAFCSSSNTFFTQRLNFVTSLLSVNALLVAHVSIENQSAFADVATSADDTIWSQYVLNTVAV